MKALILILFAAFPVESKNLRGGLIAPEYTPQPPSPLIVWVDGGIEGDLPGVEFERERIRQELEESFPENEFKLIRAKSLQELSRQFTDLDQQRKISHFFVDAHGNENSIFFGNSTEQPQVLILANELRPAYPNSVAQTVFANIQGRFTQDSRIVFRSCRVLQGSPAEVENRVRAIQKLFGVESGIFYANSVDGVIPKSRTHPAQITRKMAQSLRWANDLLLDNRWVGLRSSVGAFLVGYSIQKLAQRQKAELATFYVLFWAPAEWATYVLQTSETKAECVRMLFQAAADFSYLAYQSLTEIKAGIPTTIAIAHLTNLGLLLASGGIDLPSALFPGSQSPSEPYNVGFLATFADHQLRSLEGSTYEQAEQRFVAPPTTAHP